MGFRIANNKFEYIQGYKTNIEKAKIIINSVAYINVYVSSEGFEEELSNVVGKCTSVNVNNKSSKHIDLDISKIKVAKDCDITFVKFNVKEGKTKASRVTFIDCNIGDIIIEGNCRIVNPMSINSIVSNTLTISVDENTSETEIKNDVHIKTKKLIVFSGWFNNVFADIEQSIVYNSLVGNITVTGNVVDMTLYITPHINYSLSSNNPCVATITGDSKISQSQIKTNNRIYFESISALYLLSQNIKLIDLKSPKSNQVKFFASTRGFSQTLIKSLTNDELQLLKPFAEAPLIEYFISKGDTDFIEKRLNNIKPIPFEHIVIPFKMNATVKFLSSHPLLVPKYLKHIQNVVEYEKSIADLYKIIYKTKIKKIYGAHVNDFTAKYITANTEIIGSIPYSNITKTSNLFNVTNVKVIDKLFAHMSPESIEEVMFNDDVYNIHYEGLNTKISLKEYIFITKYMNTRVLPHRISIDRWDINWIKSHINIEYLMYHFYRLFDNNELDGPIFQQIYKGNEMTCLKIGLISRNTPLSEYIVNNIKSTPKLIPISTLKELIREMGLYPDRYNECESILFYALTKKIKITPVLYKKLLDSEEYGNKAIDYASLVDINAWKTPDKNKSKNSTTDDKQINIKFNTHLMNKLVQMELTKMSKQVLFSKRQRIEGYIYLDTINELKSLYNKGSEEYSILKLLETKALKNNNTVLIEDLHEHDKVEVLDAASTFDALIKIEQLNIENNELYKGSPRKPGYIYEDTIEEYNYGQNYLNQISLSNLIDGERISEEQLSTMAELDKTDMMKKIYSKVTTITNYICEQKKCRISSQTLKSINHDVFRCNYKNYSELKDIASNYIFGDEFIKSVDDYLTVTTHPVSSTHLTLAWVRFEIFEDIKTIWINENQTDMTKKLKFSLWDTEASNKLNDKLLFNALLLFQKWIRAHYPEFTVVLPGYILRNQLLMGEPTPAGYDNPAKKLGFKKSTLMASPMQSIKMKKKRDGLVWIWSPLTESKQV